MAYGQAVTFTSPFIINCMAQEGNYLWIGSIGGLTRMDVITGNKTVYTCSNTPMVANNITALFIDNAGNKWVGCQDFKGGFYKFDGYNWTDYTISPGGDTLFQVKKIKQDIFGRVIALDPSYKKIIEIIDGSTISTIHNNQLPVPNAYIRDFDTDSLGNFWFATTKGVMHNDSLSWTIYDTSNVYNGFMALMSIEVDHKGVVWVTNQYSSNNYRVNNFNGITWAIDSSSFANSAGRGTILIDSKNNKFFFSSNEPVIQYNDTNWQIFSGNYCSGNALSFVIDSLGNSFSAIYYRDSIDRYYYGSCQTFPSTSFSFFDNYFESVTIGDDNLVYATNREGLFQTNGVWIKKIPTPSQISNFRKIRFDHSGNLWLISYDSQTFLSHLAKWDGNSWTVYPYSYDFEDLAVAPNGDIWFGTRNGLLKYDGFNFQNYVFSSPSSTSTFVFNLTIDTAGVVWFTCDDYGKFDGTTYTWYTQANYSSLYPNPHYIHADSKGNVWFYNGNWNVAGDLIKYDGNTWTNYNSSNSNWPDSCEFISFHEEKDGTLWFGTVRGLIKYDGLNFTLYDNLQNHMGYYPVYDFARDNAGNFWCADGYNLCVFNPNGIYYIELEPKKEISGSVYFDANNDGNYDSTEVGIPNRKILMEPDSIYRLTNNVGVYTFYSDSSDCKVSLIPINGYTITSDSALFHVSIDSTLNCCYDFGLFPNQAIHDVNLSLVTMPSRCLYPMNAWLNIGNNGTVPENLRTWLLPDSTIIISNAVPPPSLISGDTLYWNISNLSPFAFEQIFITLFPNNALLFPGDTLSYYAGVTNSSGSLTFDSDSSISEYHCSIDPNDKIVSPIGDTIFHTIGIRDTLEYTIRFQNTGNDTALSVIIYDTLDANLDINTFEFVASSHVVDIKYDAKGSARFAFYHIMLPDSHVNQTASQGFIRYRISPKQNLPDSTRVNNTSFIFFDFNNPVKTNTVFNTLLNPGGGISTLESQIEGLYVFPNPIRNQELQVDFSVKPEKPFLFQFYDLSGRIVFSTSMHTQKNNTIKLPLLDDGMYSCIISNGIKRYFRKVIVMNN